MTPARTWRGRRGARALAAVRAARPGWWAAAGHVVPGLFAGLVDAGLFVPAFERARASGLVVAAGRDGVELWDAHTVVPVVRLGWEHVAAVLPGPPADTPRGTRPALRVTTLGGASLPVVLASARGAAWSAAAQDEVDASVARLRALRDGS